MFEIGHTIGDYQIIDILGAGGMGKVYKVRNVISDRVEALKVLLPNLEADPELGDRFIREIKVQASLDHPNIAKLHTALRAENQLLMVMEFVEGCSLESLLRSGPIPLANGAHYICQVLSALAYAHSRGIVHRDIKPANMMLTPDGVVKLMDFGIARVAEADRKLTQTGRTVGSLYYMSPEQIQGGTVDARADLYSVGVSLYELVTGRRPFQGDSDYSIMAAHLAASPVPPIQIDPSLPSAMNEIILMSIAKDAAQRFQSAEAFCNALWNVYLVLTGQAQPAVAPAVATAPAAAAAPSPQPAPPRVAAKTGSRRGLYMVLGSLVTIAVLILAVTQVPRWLKTRAGENPAQPSAVSAPAAEQNPAPVSAPQQAAPQPTPAAQAQEPVTPAVPQASAPQASAPQAIAPAQSVARPSSPGRGTAPTAAAGQASSAPPQAPVEASQPPSPQSHQAAPQPPAQQTAPAADSAKQTALKEARQRIMLMAARVAGVKPSLDNLRREQARMGLSLRPDIVAAQQRLEYQMDEADNSIKAGDPAAAKTHLDLAERDLDKLESFLGR